MFLREVPSVNKIWQVKVIKGWILEVNWLHWFIYNLLKMSVFEILNEPWSNYCCKGGRVYPPLWCEMFKGGDLFHSHLCAGLCGVHPREKYCTSFCVFVYTSSMINSFIYILRLEGIGYFQDASVCSLQPAYFWQSVASHLPYTSSTCLHILSSVIIKFKSI